MSQPEGHIQLPACLGSFLNHSCAHTFECTLLDLSYLNMDGYRLLSMGY